jgi:hypothetical protein
MDYLEGELTSELENARLVRLLAKFGFINERPECVLMPPNIIVLFKVESWQVRAGRTMERDWGPVHHQTFP